MEPPFPEEFLERQKGPFGRPLTHSLCEMFVVKSKAWRLTFSMVYQNKKIIRKIKDNDYFLVSDFKSNHHVSIIYDISNVLRIILFFI